MTATRFSWIAMLAVGAALASLDHASAQSEAATAVRPKPAFDLGGGFATVRANASPGECGCFFMIGETAHASLIGRNHLATVVDFSMTHKANINGTNYSLTLQTYTIGERYQKIFGHKASPFAQVLFGVARSKTPYLLDNNKTSLAALFGAGLDMKISSRLGLRVIEANYLESEIPNSKQNIQNQLRITTGFVYQLR